MNGVQTRFKCKLDVKRCKRFVFPPSSLLPRSNALKTKAIRYFQTDRTLTRIVSPPLGAAWKEAIKKLDMTWPQMSDLKFWQSEGAQLYAVNSIPHTVLIDGSGKIIARGLHGEELQAKIAEAVK